MRPVEVTAPTSPRAVAGSTEARTSCLRAGRRRISVQAVSGAGQLARARTAGPSTGRRRSPGQRRLGALALGRRHRGALQRRRRLRPRAGRCGAGWRSARPPPPAPWPPARAAAPRTPGGPATPRSRARSSSRLLLQLDAREPGQLAQPQLQDVARPGPRTGRRRSSGGRARCADSSQVRMIWMTSSMSTIATSRPSTRWSRSRFLRPRRYVVRRRTTSIRWST